MSKLLALKIYITFLSLHSLVHADSDVIKGYHLKIFNFHDYNEKSYQDHYTIENIIESAFSYGLESQQKMEALFQAHQDVKIRLSSILPQIDLIGVHEFIFDESHGINTIIPFIGFIFPGRWLEWRAAKHVREAKRIGIATLLANLTQEIQHLYYDIQMQVWSLRVLDFYINELDRLIAHIKNSQQKRASRFSMEDLAILINVRARMQYNRAFMDSLAADLPHMATLMGLSPDKDWAELKLEPCSIDFALKPKLNYFDFWAQSVDKSTEIQSLHSLIKAAKKTMQAHYLDFFDPHGHNLGLGYAPRIKISRSKIKVLEMEIERTKMTISNAIQHSLNYYTEATTSMAKLQEGLRSLEAMRISVEAHITNEDVPLDITRVVRLFETAESQTLNYIHSYFVYRTASADFDRYTWNGNLYQLVHHYRTIELPYFLKMIKQEHSFRHRIKRRINKSLHNCQE